MAFSLANSVHAGFPSPASDFSAKRIYIMDRLVVLFEPVSHCSTAASSMEITLRLYCSSGPCLGSGLMSATVPLRHELAAGSGSYTVYSSSTLMLLLDG
ncbi:hypothetical protein ASE11_14795 [Hydrogenophaga sp. Root209]|uniref:hypothetical protein n=1 Tax=Hydrogenophaga sp. Root209 TaxID=1736490 RepID=UPI0006F20FAD|nr:hypothetical protein [Hydrogenophaga sp. Root209]KRB98070.1 hypothetical protein ASE11_14795 [Hydrogenophaga sp. Root209]